MHSGVPLFSVSVLAQLKAVSRLVMCRHSIQMREHCAFINSRKSAFVLSFDFLELGFPVPW